MFSILNTMFIQTNYLINFQVKSIRSVIVAGGMEYDDFQQSMRSLDVSLITSVKDLRSQIVRETCITLA